MAEAIKNAVKGLKPKTMVQYCADVCYFNETLRAVPRSIKIESISFTMGNLMLKRKRKAVPNDLKRLGVTSSRETLNSTEHLVRMQGISSRKSLVDTARKLSGKLDEDLGWARVQRMELSYMGAKATFSKTTKAIHPDDSDMRRKLKVLGLTNSEGNIAPLIKELSAKKYSCTFQRTFSDHIICSELKK